ncbi:helix-turn-helix domain-containing protein [Hyphomonas sp. GM-8P]|uniref:helix-turn-helix domain-containing protein n=1 Tax=Hyphomonas sp. GM-8P TaxID=1280945 RepID=UPI0013144E02|nr:helix-turn-helix domain-containing protein [Hyphomonas sp. GM-8P]|tara:strand:+ start:767 stop:1162 length:396 start_codon:yes stop_codon:yes gene_type:complete
MREVDDAVRLMSNEIGLPIYKRYSEEEAAQHLGMSKQTLKRLRDAGRIGFVRVSKRKLSFFGFQLAEYLLNAIEETTCRDTQPTTDTRSASIGSGSAPGVRHGIECGSTPKLAGPDALASAQRILKKQRQS